MKNIVLIGMPGAGKSTVGVLLAKTLGRSFLDTDLLIQQREGQLLQDIIDSRGVEAFLKAEEAAVLSIASTHTVIATGGSVIYSSSAMNHLSMNGRVIYLEVSYQVLVKRIRNITTRGIALGKNQSLREMYTGRLPLYEKFSDLTVCCDGKDMEAVLGEINTGLQRTGF